MRRAVVTGGGSGIGKGIAKMLSESGFFVYVVDLDEEKTKLSAEEIVGSPVVLDVGDQPSICKFFDTLKQEGGIDTLVNSAAIVKLCPIIDVSAEVWNSILRVNLNGALWCAQEAAKIMKKKRFGRIVNISSVNGQVAISDRGAYSVSKAGLDMMTKLFALELGEYGITVNGVAPSPVDTPMLREANRNDKMLNIWKNSLPISRFASIDEVVSVVKFLISEESSYVNGVTINVDGGFCSTGIKM